MRSSRLCSSSAGAAVSSFGEILAGAVLYPFEAAVIALVYIDLRMRREGLDLELIRASQNGWPRPRGGWA